MKWQYSSSLARVDRCGKEMKNLAGPRPKNQECVAGGRPRGPIVLQGCTALAQVHETVAATPTTSANESATGPHPGRGRMTWQEMKGRFSPPLASQTRCSQGADKRITSRPHLGIWQPRHRSQPVVPPELVIAASPPQMTRAGMPRARRDEANVVLI